MAAHQVLTVATRAGRWRLRLHDDGRAEVLRFTPAGTRGQAELLPATAPGPSLPLHVLEARVAACASCDHLGKGECARPCILRARQRGPQSKCPKRRW